MYELNTSEGRADMPPLFDFSPYAGKSAGYLTLIKELAGGIAFRSAAVDELVLEGDFYRRPLRPEDFEFLEFRKPVRAATVSRLPSLASHRTLLSLYELTSATPPEDRNPARLAAFAEFANERNRIHAAQIAPFLEAYAFEYLSNGLSDGETVATCAARLGNLYTSEYDFWNELFGHLKANGYLEEGLRFILIQRWCLAPSKRRVLAEALARGHFAGWPEASVPKLDSDLLGDESFRRIATILGVDRQQHSYWQFYLPTSLAKCNLLYALARRSEQAFALYGALYAAQAEWLAFEAAIARNCPHLVAGAPVGKSDPDLQRHFEITLHFLTQRHGNMALTQLAHGLGAADRLAERARWDLGEQLKWLSSIDRYCHYAHSISQRIEVECPDIERETFVEPRDMCSTTHVHNDHRLVTIQEGVMHFWGNIGMRLEMNEGDRVLIPDGRLHGSTVLSPECTYHQPIIPDAWIQDVLARAPEPARRAE